MSKRVNAAKRLPNTAPPIKAHRFTAHAPVPPFRNLRSNVAAALGLHSAAPGSALYSI